MVLTDKGPGEIIKKCSVPYHVLYGDVLNNILINDGSIQKIENIPKDIKELYKTTWEISQKSIIDQAADRSPFIDQAQSTNLFLASPDIGKLGKMHMYSWRRGNKTGMYYLRRKPVRSAVKITTTPMDIDSLKHDNISVEIENNEEECELCSS